MSDFDALRQVFDDLAGDPPLVLGRKEAVMIRVSRRLQRTAIARGMGALALASVLGVSAVGTTLHFTQTGSDSHEPITLETSPSPTGSPTPQGIEPTHRSEPTHAAEPTHSPSSEPRQAPTTAPATEPTHEATPPAVEPTHAQPTPEDTAASGPLTVSLSMSPSTVDTSTDTHALVTARDGDGRLLAVDVDWGDGKTTHFSPGDVPCPRTTHLNGSFNHRYASAGSYVVHVMVTTGDCAPQEQVTREGHVTVTGSEPTSSASETNGSAAPVASGAPRSGDNSSYAYITAGGSDSDGWISRIVVHWGDGAESSYGYSTGSCTNASGTSHPVSNQQTSSVPGGHHYATAGDHTATVTVTSVACDGSSPQTGSTSFTVTQPSA